MSRSDPAFSEERIFRLRQLTESDPNDEVVWFGLGRALLELDRPAEAIEAFRRAVKLKPDYTAAYRDLGRSLLESGAVVEAAEVFAHAIGLAEKTGDLQTGREIHVFLRRAEKAVGES